MNHTVSDDAVDQYVARIRGGGPLGKVFPGKMSECAFTPQQREKIRQARAEKRVLLKSAKPSAPTVPPVPQPKGSNGIRKLKRILYLQMGNCFFCGRALRETDASIEHLNPKSRGGTSTEDNEVVCHKTLNEVFGDMDLKHKFEFVLKAKGSFRCPGT